MGLLECASGASVWRGYDYYIENKVLSFKKEENGYYTATVSGSSKSPYMVELHLDHPRKSKCNCPHANGKRIICKHMVAVYFSIFPDEAKRFYNEAMVYEEEQEKRQELIYENVRRYVSKMKKSELQYALLELLFDGPDWQYDHFVRENGLDEEWR